MLNNFLGPATSYGMRRRKDLTGQTFDRLTATSCVGINKKGEALWACDCICGGTTTVRASRLRSAETRSCGCLRSPFADLTAQTFGQLTAIKFEERKDHTTWWMCDCTCGKTKLVRADHLKSGAIRSCGCKIRRAPLIDIAGQKFGLLTAIKCIGRKKGEALWACNCDCGDTHTLRGSRLRSEETRSCGCLSINTPEEAAIAAASRRIRNNFAAFMRAKGFKKKSATFTTLGYTARQAKEHIEALFKPGMTWDNRNEWHIDHIVPCFTAKTKSELIALYALNNLQPLWAHENIRKGTKLWHPSKTPRQQQDNQDKNNKPKTSSRPPTSIPAARITPGRRTSDREDQENDDEYPK